MHALIATDRSVDAAQTHKAASATAAWSGLMRASRTTLPHLTTSPAMNFPNSAVD